MRKSKPATFVKKHTFGDETVVTNKENWRDEHGT